jgi:hypothetical protein
MVPDGPGMNGGSGMTRKAVRKVDFITWLQRKMAVDYISPFV